MTLAMLTSHFSYAIFISRRDTFMKLKAFENKDQEYGKSLMINQVMNELSKMDDSSFKKEFTKILKKKYGEYIVSFGESKPTKYEKKFCYFKTINYRGYKIDVFDDDYGQSCYFYFNNHQYGCGTYNFEYEECIKYIVDEYLDKLFNFALIDKKYSGAYLRYVDHEHTKISFTYRMEKIKEFDASMSIDGIKKECINMLDNLFKNEEFIKMENERKSRGDLYFHELIDLEK